jgi:hypothetical protein
MRRCSAFYFGNVAALFIEQIGAHRQRCGGREGIRRQALLADKLGLAAGQVADP